MAKTPPQEAFINKVASPTDLIPVDSYMVVRAPYRKATLLFASDKDKKKEQTEPFLIVSVGNYVQVLRPGMLVLMPGDTEGLKIFEEPIQGKIPKVGGLAATLSLQEGTPEMIDGIVGYYDYYVVDRNNVIGYMDPRTDEQKAEDLKLRKERIAEEEAEAALVIGQ